MENWRVSACRHINGVWSIFFLFFVFFCCCLLYRRRFLGSCCLLVRSLCESFLFCIWALLRPSSPPLPLNDNTEFLWDDAAFQLTFWTELASECSAGRRTPLVSSPLLFKLSSTPFLCLYIICLVNNSTAAAIKVVRLVKLLSLDTF